MQRSREDGATARGCGGRAGETSRRAWGAARAEEIRRRAGRQEGPAQRGARRCARTDRRAIVRVVDLTAAGRLVAARDSRRKDSFLPGRRFLFGCGARPRGDESGRYEGKQKFVVTCDGIPL